jgi:DNA repair ATPase RecN
MIKYIKNIYYTIITMNVDELINNLKFTEEELQKTKEELIQTKEHLKKYTAPSNMKKYYENHKEEIKQKVKEHKEKTNYVYVPSPEQKKEWARTAYLNKKAKLKKMEEKNEKENI